MKGWSNFKTGVQGILREAIPTWTPVTADAVAPASPVSSVA
uniref:Uncharacterized protein n=1 Tax=Anguilla anguilla TaxID=7936 RepID=A0A0E9W735_ANGAN